MPAIQPTVAVTAAKVSDASPSGRTVLTGTPAQGATALGVGTADSPTHAGLTISGTVNAGGYQLAGDQVLGSPDGFYRALMAYGQQIATFGGASDPNTYLNNGSLRCRTRDYLTTYATFANGAASVNGTFRPGVFTVATLPAGVVGALVFVSNGRKGAEGAGAGTGVVACYSNNNWRRLSDDSPVAA